MTIAYHYFPNSHWSRVVSLVIAEKGIDVSRVFVDIRKNATFEPDYLRINERGVVPTVVHDGRSIRNSMRIAAHLDEVSGPPLYTGLDSEEVNGWAERLEAFPVMLFSYSVWVKGERGEKSADILDDKVQRARRYAEQHPDLADAYHRKASFFEAFRKQVYDADFVRAERERCGAILDEMGEVVKQRRWLAGDDYSFADAIATSVLYRLVDLRLLDHWHEDADHGLSAYFARLRDRPSFRAVFVDDPLIP